MGFVRVNIQNTDVPLAVTYIADSSDDMENVPVTGPVGEVCVCADGEIYIHNTSDEWVEYRPAGSGGGAGMIVVNATADGEPDPENPRVYPMTIDKTKAEMKAAYQAGTYIVASISVVDISGVILNLSEIRGIEGENPGFVFSGSVEGGMNCMYWLELDCGASSTSLYVSKITLEDPS